MNFIKYMLILLNLLIFFSVSFQTCLNKENQCNICSYNYYENNFLNTLNLHSPNKFPSSECSLKNPSIISRKILIDNGNCQVLSCPNLIYDKTYISLNHFFEEETKIITKFLNSKIELNLSPGDHFILKKNFNYDIPEIFRKSLLELTISGSLISPSNIITKTNEYHIFISKLLKIENVYFYGNDINNKKNDNIDACYNKNIICCNEEDFNQEMKEDCSLKNKIIKNSYSIKIYGLFNLEKMIESNIDPLIFINNCTFNNISPLNIEKGYSTFISMAPYSGNILIENTNIYNCFFPKGFIYYNKFNFDKIYNELINLNVIYQEINNLSYNITILKTNITNYNTFSISNNEIGSLGFVNLFEINAKIFVINTTFFKIVDSNIIFNVKFLLGTNKFNSSNNYLNDIRNTKIFDFQNVDQLIIDYLILNEYSGNQIILFVNKANFIIINFLDIKIIKLTSADLFNFNNAIVYINHSIFYNIISNMLLYQENSYLSLLNCSFSQIKFIESLIYSYQSDKLFIKESSFKLISGENSIIKTNQLEYMNLTYSFFNEINCLSIFDLIKGYSMLNYYLLISDSNLQHFVKKDSESQIQAFFHCEIKNNNIYWLVLWNNNLQISFYLQNVSIHDNKFSTKAIFKIYRGYSSMINLLLINNFFLYPNNFCCVVDLETSTIANIYDSYFESNGIIAKRSSETVNDNCLLDFWAIDYAMVQNSVFVGMGKTDLVSGFICASPFGKIFELHGNHFIILKNQEPFYYKGVFVDNAVSMNITNNIFTNMVCNKASIYHMHGGALFLYGSSNYFYVRNEYKILLDNNTFNNCNCFYGGSIAIISIKEVIIKNCSFYNSSSTYFGGNIILASGEKFTLENIFISNSTGTDGSALYIFNIFNLVINNLQISNINGTGNGAIFFKDNKIVKITNLISNNSLVSLKGGLMAIYNSYLIIENTTVIKSQSLSVGGSFYIKGGSTIYIKNLQSYYGFGLEGGFIYIDDSEIVSLENIIIQDSFASVSGAFAFINIVKSLYFINISTIKCKSVNGNGIIFIKTENEKSIIKLKDFICQENYGLFGSCIFFLSASYLSIDNLTIDKNFENSITLQNSFAINIDINDLIIKNIISIKQPIIYLSTVNLNITNLLIKNNSNLDFFFFMEFSYCSIINSTFVNNKNYYALSITSSELQIFNITFKNGLNYLSSFLKSLESVVNIKTSLINNLINTENKNIDFQLGKLNLFNANFLNCLGISIYALNSDLNLNNITFYNNSGLTINLGNDLYVENSLAKKNYTINVSFSEFTTFNGISSVFSGNIIINSLLNKYIVDERFKTDTSAFLILNIISMTILNSTLQSFTDTSLKMINSKDYPTLFKIENCNFPNNKGTLGGSLYINGKCDLNILNSNFTNNSALKKKKNINSLEGIGGSIFYTSISDSIQNKFKVFNCIFANNFAEFIVPTIFSDIKMEIKNSMFLNNSDNLNFTNKYYNPPLTIKFNDLNLSDKNKYYNSTQLTITSGQPFNLTLNLIDGLSNILLFDNLTLFSAKSFQQEKSNPLNLQNDLVQISEGIIHFKNLIVYSNSHKFIDLIIEGKFSSLFQPNYLSLSIPVYVRKCLIGEIVDSNRICYKCPSETYSLEDPMNSISTIQKCNYCPENAICPGGSLIYPIPGYYRKSNESIFMISCFNEKVCLGNTLINNCSLDNCTSDNINGECLEGNSGTLCFYCPEFFGKVEKSDVCKQCAEIGTLIYMRVILYGALITFYILLNSYFAGKYNEEKENILKNFNLYFKIIVNHSQHINIIIINEIKLFSQDLMSFSQFSDYFSFSNDEITTNDCILQNFYNDQDNILVIRAIFNTIIPFFFSVIAFIFWYANIIFYEKIYKKQLLNQSIQSITNKFLLYLIFSIFLFYPLIVKSYFTLFDCMKLDKNENQTYLRNSPDYLCWDSSHFKQVFIAGLPGIIFWGPIFPLLLYLILKKNSDYVSKYTSQVSRNSSISSKSPKGSIAISHKIAIQEGRQSIKLKQSKIFSFFYRGFRKQLFFWECLIFLRKFLLSLFATLSETLTSEIKSMLILIVLFYFLYILVERSPYQDKKANYLEISSIICCIITVISCELFITAISEQTKTAWVAICMIPNLIFFFIAAFIILQDIYNRKNLIKLSIIKSKKYYIKDKSKVEKEKNLNQNEQKVIIDEL